MRRSAPFRRLHAQQHRNCLTWDSSGTPIGTVQLSSRPRPHAGANEMVSSAPPRRYAEEGSLFRSHLNNAVSLVGIDLGKHCFHVHAQDAVGRMVFRKKLSRQ